MQTIQSKLLNPFHGIIHGFTTKQHKNLAFHVGDALKNVLQNHTHLAETFPYTLSKLVHMQQIHSDIVKLVEDKDNFANPPKCDALITDKKNTPLMVMVADCSPLLFYDAKKEVIAVAHAGRAGAFSNIVHNVCKSFQNDFHSQIEDIYVTVGPSIHPCCYEVGEEIYKEAKALHLEYALTQKENSYYLDIPSILRKQLLASGIDPRHMEFSNECSCCTPNKYFSYRAKKKTGRFAGIISLV